MPPTIHLETLNEHIALDDSPFYVNTELQSWSAALETPRRAAVSSFGFSGTNAHLVIEEYLRDRDATTNSIPVDANNPIAFRPVGEK